MPVTFITVQFTLNLAVHKYNIGFKFSVKPLYYCIPFSHLLKIANIILDPRSGKKELKDFFLHLLLSGMEKYGISLRPA